VKDHEVIEAFVAHLRGLGHRGLQVDGWPDRKNSGDIDAISGRFHIEHTSVDTLPNQRRDADWFSRVTDGLETELSASLPSHLRIKLEYGAIGTGQDWSAIREALRTWITSQASMLAEGTHCIENAAGVPFSLHVTKASERPPGLVLARYEPVDETLPSRIREQFDRKAQKLSRYASDSRTTILLVESYDVSLMSMHRMLEAIRQAYPTGLPIGVDELWYADTSIPDEVDFMNLTAMLGGSASGKQA
jgi:hypothetical protein